jgi:hypothetical protein
MSIVQSDDDPIARIPNGIELPNEESDESTPPPLYIFVEMLSNHSPGSTGLLEEDLVGAW